MTTYSPALEGLMFAECRTVESACLASLCPKSLVGHRAWFFPLHLHPPETCMYIPPPHSLFGHALGIHLFGCGEQGHSMALLARCAPHPPLPFCPLPKLNGFPPLLAMQDRTAYKGMIQGWPTSGKGRGPSKRGSAEERGRRFVNQSTGADLAS